MDTPSRLQAGAPDARQLNIPRHACRRPGNSVDSRMAKLPLILVSASMEKRGVEFNDLSLSLSQRYEDAMLNVGAIPLVAPATVDRAVLAEAVRRTDGVLLTGGDDICPDLYATDLPADIRKTVGQTPDGGGRDLRELILIEEVFRQKKPLLCICRGHQLINVAFGGGLICDIRRQFSTQLNHQRSDKACEYVHDLALTPGSQIARITGTTTLGVNSSHHQAVAETAEPFVATGVSPDGLVEAMELRPGAARLPYFLSVQFHPERLTPEHAEHRAIFTSFVKACKKR